MEIDDNIIDNITNYNNLYKYFTYHYHFINILLVIILNREFEDGRKSPLNYTCRSPIAVDNSETQYKYNNFLFVSNKKK